MSSFKSYSFNWLKIISIITILVTVGVYAYFKTSNLIAGPTITLQNPIDLEIIEDSFIKITGQAERISKIYLNDRQIFTDANGYFKEPLILFKGYNILTLRAEDQFGRTIIKKLHLVHEPSESKPLKTTDLTYLPKLNP